MKLPRLLAYLLLTLLMLSISIYAGKDSSLNEDGTGIKWYGYQDGWEKAKAENKHMFVDFTATWCGWCKRLEASTFKDTSVVRLLNNDFVPVKVWDHSKDTLNLDGYVIAERDLIKREFRVSGFPSLWFVSPHGVRIGPAGGYIDAPRLLSYLDIVQHYRYDSTRTETGEKIVPEKK